MEWSFGVLVPPLHGTIMPLKLRNTCSELRRIRHTKSIDTLKNTEVLPDQDRNVFVQRLFFPRHRHIRHLEAILITVMNRWNSKRASTRLQYHVFSPDPKQFIHTEPFGIPLPVLVCSKQLTSMDGVGQPLVRRSAYPKQLEVPLVKGALN